MMFMTVYLKDGEAMSMQMPSCRDKAYELAAQVSLLESVAHVEVPAMQRFIDGEQSSSYAMMSHDGCTLNIL